MNQLKPNKNCSRMKISSKDFRLLTKAARTQQRKTIPSCDHAVSVVMFMRTVSEMNCREHFMAVANRKKQQRTATAMALATLTRRPTLPVVVTLTRFGPKALDDDNLRGAMKFCRDEIASYYGVNDGGKDIEWRYGQEICTDYLVWVRGLKENMKNIDHRLQDIAAAESVLLRAIKRLDDSKRQIAANETDVAVGALRDVTGDLSTADFVVKTMINLILKGE
jgi:hypothetical protein